MTEYGDQPGDGCAYGCDEHPQPDCPTHRGATTERAAQLAQARYLGADAALTAASWLTMDEADARSILEDVDPEVMDRYPEPNLSGEWADGLTPASLADEVGYYGDDQEAGDAIADAWEAGRDEVWSDALQGVALRVLGDVVRALDVEHRNETRVDALRAAR